MTPRTLTAQFMDVWAKLTMLQRVSIVAATVAVLSSVVVLIIWANKPAYRTLYSDMAEADVKQIADSLQAKSIQYKVNGNAVEVLQDNVYDTRMMLAAEGLPREKSTGFELFDETKLGMTEFAQNVNFQRALQGELANTITALNEVAEAKVLITIPKERLFVEDTDEIAKASVVIKPMPGATIAPDQIKSIAHLVASSVKGLVPEAVQIVDTNGNLLSDFLTEETQPLLLTQTQFDQQKAEEKRFETGLRNVLMPILGDGKFVVKVSVELDYNKQEILREEYGDTGVVRSQNLLEENAKNMGKAPMGIPGVESNLAEPDILVDGIVSEYSKTQEIQNFEINKTTTREERTGGVLKRLAVAVVVDDKMVVAEENGEVVTTKAPRTEEDIQKLRGTIAGAVGIDPGRGDVLDVTNISFDTTNEAIDNVITQRERTMEIISMSMKYASAIIILVLFYFLIMRPILLRLDRSKEIDEELLGESAIDAQMTNFELNVGGDSGFPKTIDELEREIEAELDESTPIDVEAIKSKVMLKKIEEQANEDPEMIANLVKSLIKGT